MSTWRNDNVSVLPPLVSPDDESIFGGMVCGGDLEDWCFAVLSKWSCTYLAEVARRHGLAAGKLPDVRAWVPAPSFDKWPEDQIPGVIVTTAGTAERPLKGGDGGYRARWAVRVGVLCSAATQAQARRLAQLYLLAHRLILVQRPSLEGHAAGVDWLGDEYQDLDYDDTRSLAAATGLFTIEVEGVGYADAGPVTPDDPQEPCTEPWEPWTTVRLVDIDVENYPLPDPLPPPKEE